MNANAGTLEIVLTEQTIGAELRCQIGYKDCSQEVWWLGDGFCPRCWDRPPTGRFICNSCHDHIISGAPMSHRACGCVGIATDFYKIIKPI